MAKAIFGEVFGPRRTECGDDRINWTFFAKLSDGISYRYRLTYFGREREFRTRRYSASKSYLREVETVSTMIGIENASFHPQKCRSITETLKQGLSDDDIADAAALSLSMR